ncbi:hypothetical protein GGI35DRAFT_475827 [Trichoderma velutinum]
MDLIGNSKIILLYFKEHIAILRVLDFIGNSHMSVLVITTTCVLTVVTIYWVSRRRTSSAESQRLEKILTPTTYRVSGVPLDWDRDKLWSFLKRSIRADVMVIESLAPEANIESQTATVTITGSYLPHWPGITRQYSLLEEYSNESQYFDRSLSVEREFIGLTTLYEPPARDHKIDVIALSGLGGHAFGSFKERGGTHMWLRDSLPGHLTSETDNRPMARVMIYGYESAVAQSKNMQNLEDLATAFHSSLLALAAGPTTRPIILVGHSLGGLIIKQTLISLARSTIPDDQKLIRAVYGVIFFGTPHDGMDISSLIPMVGDGPNRFLIESISRINSQIISIQQRDFHYALGKKGDSEVFCFYETLESPTAQRDKRGEWKMIGPTAVLVTKSSATHCRPWEDGSENICAIARTHSNMVKFGPHDPEYRNVFLRIRGLSRRAIRVRDRLQTTTSKFLVPYRQNPDFVGRSDIFNKIKLQFGLGQQGEHEHSQSRRRVSLYGLGGVGKTQLALAYAYWIRDTCPDISVFWVHASNADRFRAAYAFIAEKCDVPGRENPKVDILLLVKRWLEEQNKIQWLMIIDNFDDIELFFPQPKSNVLDAQQQGDKLARYIPDCGHGSILITTRNKQVGVKFDQGSPLIEVTKMTGDEAHQLVQSILKTEVSTDDVFLLASKLEHLPLALAQATSFIQENAISISDYIQLLDEGDNALVNQLSESFEPVGRDSETPHALTATWILSFRQIEQTQPLASDTLCFLSLMHRQAIPQTFIEEWQRQRHPEDAQGNTSARLIKALGVLKAFSFISEGKDKHIDMHRLVQLVTRKWLISSGRMHEIVECAIRVVSSSYPFGKFETYQVCLRYAPHVNSVLAREGTNSKAEKMDKSLLLHKFARYYYHRGEWENAERILLQAATIQAQEFGEEHSETLSTRCDLVSVYIEQGRLREAEALASQIIELKKRVHGQDHPATLTSMNKLAVTYETQGRLKEAEDLHLYVIETRKRVLREDDLEMMESLGNLAGLYIRQGRLKEAEEETLQVIRAQKRVLGEEHLYTIHSMSNLSIAYRLLGRLKESEDWAVQAAEICQRVAGESHPTAMRCIGNLAIVYQAQGRLKEAETLFLQVVEISKRVLGEEHPSTAGKMSNLARLYQAQGRWKESEDLELHAIRVMTAVLGQDHPDTLTGISNLALIHINQGRWKEAEDLGGQVMEARIRTLGEEHPETIDDMALLTKMYQAQGRWKEAEDLGLQLVRAMKKKLGEKHPNTLTCMSNLAVSYENQERWKEAADLGTQVMEARKETLGEEHPDTLVSKHNVACALKGLGKSADAIALMEECLRVQERVLGKDHPTMAAGASLLDKWRREP